MHPFTRTDVFNLKTPSPPLHLLSGLDWLVLGRPTETLGKLVRQALCSLRDQGLKPVLRVAPYASVCGPLPQSPHFTDIPVTLAKNFRNFNQPAWMASMRALLELPEERWGEVGIANTSDRMHIFEKALDRLVLRPPRVIVDLGCGLGQLARSLAQRYPGAQVLGFDSSAEAIAVASKAFRLPNLRFGQKDFSKPLGLKPGSVDLLVSVNALPYAQDQLGSARELFGLLAPDGVLLNHCRTEESHMFWDFPASLLLPTNTQLLLADWVQEAGLSGRATEVLQSPQDMAPEYFLASMDEGFLTQLRGYAEAHRSDVPGPYRAWSSHALLAHAAHGEATDPATLPLEPNHLARLGAVLPSFGEAPGEVRSATVLSWLRNSTNMELWPEALDVMEALLPGQARQIRAVLEPALADRPQKESPASA